MDFLASPNWLQVLLLVIQKSALILLYYNVNMTTVEQKAKVTSTVQYDKFLPVWIHLFFFLREEGGWKALITDVKVKMERDVQENERYISFTGVCKTHPKLFFNVMVTCVEICSYCFCFHKIIQWQAPCERVTGQWASITPKDLRIGVQRDGGGRTHEELWITCTAV